MNLHKSTLNVKKPHGFTLVELVFAMAAFSTMLVISVSGFLNALWIYNQAAASRDNQQQVRTVVDQIGRDIRDAGRATVTTGGSGSILCLDGTEQGTVRYLATGTNLRRQVMQFPFTCVGGGIPVTRTYTDLLSGSTTKLYDASGATNGFSAVLLQQVPPTIGGGAPAQSVRISISVRRGASRAPTGRELQFSNDFSLSSTFLVRSSAQ